MWILILVVCANSSFSGLCSMTSVPDFQSAQTCNSAGVKSRELGSKIGRGIDYVCVQK